MAECFWPSATVSHLQALDERAARTAARASPANDQVGYLGSISLREDEVVLCVFEGAAEAVKDVAAGAELLSIASSTRRVAAASRPTNQQEEAALMNRIGAMFLKSIPTANSFLKGPVR